MGLKQKILAALQCRYGDVQEALEVIPATRRVTGVVISEAFEGLSHKQRQDRLWKTLREALSESELNRVGAIATLTYPEAVATEMESHR